MQNLQKLRHQYEKIKSDLTALTKRHEGLIESLKRKPAQVLADEIAKLAEVCFFVSLFFFFFFKYFNPFFRRLMKQKH